MGHADADMKLWACTLLLSAIHEVDAVVTKWVLFTHHHQRGGEVAEDSVGWTGQRVVPEMLFRGIQRPLQDQQLKPVLGMANTQIQHGAMPFQLKIEHATDQQQAIRSSLALASLPLVTSGGQIGAG